MKELILITTMLFTFRFVNAQSGQINFNNFKSSKYRYTIEYPTDFYFKEATGRNVDFKVVNTNGYSIIIVVNKLILEEGITNVSDILQIPNEQFVKAFPLPNVTVIKKGKCSKGGMFLYYTSKDDLGTNTSYRYYMNYLFVHDGFTYTITATCNVDDLGLMQAKFFRTLESFSLN